MKALLKCPLILLLAGTLGASAVAEYWRQGAWANEQKYLIKKQQLERRFQLVEDVSRAFAASITSLEDVLFMYERQLNPHVHEKEIETRREAWRAASAQWRVDQQTLYTRLLIEFPGDQREADFVQLARQRLLVANDISNLLEQPTTARDSAPAVDKALKDLKALRDRVRAFARALAADAEASDPWRHLPPD